MVYLSLGLLLLIFYYYRIQKKREKLLIKSYAPLYGPFINSFHLDVLKIDDQDKLWWGAKLYLYNDGMIIGGPSDPQSNLLILFNEVEGLTSKGRTVSFIFVHNKRQPLKIELSTGPLEQKIDNLLSTNI